MRENQLDIFTGRISRRTDPETSKSAEARYVSTGKLSQRRGQVLTLCVANPGMTAGELSPIFARKHPEISFRAAAMTPEKRLGELERLGLVERGPKRKCAQSGYDGVTWFATIAGIKLTMETL